MVFPASHLPVYPDPPNWQHQQHQNRQQQQVAVNNNPHHQLPAVHVPPPGGGGATDPGSIIRPGSMAERARLAELPQPESTLKCPRCESTNTKFCYFNNYSLTQPRHFCKTCRRYWTRGGALRNVPVGGGCRRNKRTKGSASTTSKSPAADHHPSTTNFTSRSSTVSASNGGGINSTTHHDIIAHNFSPPQLPNLFPPLHNLSDFGNGEMGLNFCGIGIQPAAAAAAANLNIAAARFCEQWRMQQFPFWSGLGQQQQQQGGGYQFEAGEANIEPLGYVGAGTTSDHQLGSKASEVKLEDQNQLATNLTITSLSSVVAAGNNDEYWRNGNSWTDLSGGSTSSATHHLM